MLVFNIEIFVQVGLIVDRQFRTCRDLLASDKSHIRHVNVWNRVVYDGIYNHVRIAGMVYEPSPVAMSIRINCVPASKIFLILDFCAIQVKEVAVMVLWECIHVLSPSTNDFFDVWLMLMESTYITFPV